MDTAIILSLSNSGIILKANKAKTDSDNANLKEYVNTLKAEWELMTAEERTESGSATFEDYANSKLEKNGYKVKLLEDGSLVNISEETTKIKLGDIIKGYTVTATTYKTDGSEQGLTGKADSTKTQTVETNTDVTWKYLGLNENGKIEIIADLSSSNTVDINSKITLSEKGGYLNGPRILNEACKKLYSVDGVGTARSMDIDDVNKILGYTGEKGAYMDSHNNYVPTQNALTIGEIESKLGMTLLERSTPDGKDLKTYYSDYYTINKGSDLDKMANPENVELVYNSKNAYWLASSCVYADFLGGYTYISGGGAGYNVRDVGYSNVGASMLYNSDNGKRTVTYAIRPIVELDSSVSLTKDTTTENTWKIN